MAHRSGLVRRGRTLCRCGEAAPYIWESILGGSAITRLLLRHPRGATPVFVGEGAVLAAAAELGPWLAGRTAFLVTTPRVRALHEEALAALVEAAGRWVVVEVPEGEEAKTPGRAAGLWRAMLAAGGKRDSRLVALGGGSVCDLAGFAAGCFLRGIEHALVPTTLLAQVDAAIGGKAAVDLPEAKNAVGLFHHPRAVVADPRFLATLPRGELRSGLLEAVKVAAVADAALLARIEAELDALLAGEPAALAPVVRAAAAAKIAVVERDPEERSGERRLLNFGHTLGHALEAAAGYRGLRHGEAVGWGMLFALRLARRHGLGDEGAARLARLLARFDLPALPEASARELLDLMKRDKKAREDGLFWVLPEGPGRGRVAGPFDDGEIAGELEAFLADPTRL